MNIGIVTVPDSYNCGSFLQAYGMKTFLEKQGHHVTFVRTRSEEYVKNLFYNNSLLVRSVIKWPVIGIRRWLFWKKCYQVFSDAWKENLDIQDRELEGFDAIVLGSDEIWNIKTEVFNRPLFYGYGKENAVAYAVSAGRATIGDFEERKDLTDYIRNLHAVFPRDKNTQNIVLHCAKREAECVCDPTLLIDWETIPSELPLELKDDHYLMIYAYSVSDEMKNNIVRYAKRNQLRIVSVGFFYMWADLNLPINPLQLFTVCKNADVIFTETFHGTIFSALSGSLFLSFPTGSVSKVNDFLVRAGYADRFIDSKAGGKEFEEKLGQKMDTEQFKCFVKAYREHSGALLTNALQEVFHET